MPSRYCLVLLFTATAAHAETIPTRFVENRFYAVPETRDGRTLTLYTDSAGGYWLADSTARALGLKVENHGEGNPPDAALPAFAAGRGIPSAAATQGRIPVMAMPPGEAPALSWDGMLGAPWFADRVWTFDYPAQRLQWESQPVALPAQHTIPMAFQMKDGKRSGAFARIQVEIAGETLDMLLDTGATGSLGDAASAATGLAKGERATSFITASTLAHWRQAHPEWRVIEAADVVFPKHPMRIIEVPQVRIAGWATGPVWFTERPDPAFHSYMAEMMDKPVEGAIGGNVFGAFVMTLDYPNALAHFRCGGACTAATAATSGGESARP